MEAVGSRALTRKILGLRAGLARDGDFSVGIPECSGLRTRAARARCERSEHIVGVANTPPEIGGNQRGVDGPHRPER
jgi:hypothetical protein